VAWLLWGIVHIYLLVWFDKRLLVSLQWLWRWLTYEAEQGSSLIQHPGPTCHGACLRTDAIRVTRAVRGRLYADQGVATELRQLPVARPAR
jgi:hypothetical protein